MNFLNIKQQQPNQKSQITQEDWDFLDSISHIWGESITPNSFKDFKQSDLRRMYEVYNKAAHKNKKWEGCMTCLIETSTFLYEVYINYNKI